MSDHRLLPLSLLLALTLLPIVPAQGPGGGRRGPMNRPDLEILERFDEDDSGMLDAAERSAAREWLAENREEAPRRGRRGPPPGKPEGEEAVERRPGEKLSPDQVSAHPDRGFYDTFVLRTLFFEFESEDWYGELSDFYHTDVEVPARLTVDGELYEDVGVRFRGNTSFLRTGSSHKKSMNVSLDAVHGKQRLMGYRTLNLLNAHADPSFLREMMFSRICGEFMPMPKANFVKVVIGGESYGIYVNLQQRNREFLKESYGTKKGVRWKIAPDFSGRAGLAYLGDDVAPYKACYEMNTGKGGEEAWTMLVDFCRILNETPTDRLEVELPKVLDVEEALWFLALDNVFLDSDGYTSRASDYALYADPDGRFHLLFHDNNEVLMSGRGGPGGPPGRRGPPPGAGPGRPDAPGGRDRPGAPGRPGEGGRRRGPWSPGPELDPLEMADRDDRPLYKQLLAVPAWRATYLEHVRTLAEDWLDWDTLGLLAQQLHEFIADEVRKDTQAIYPLEAFQKSLEDLREVSQKRRRSLLASPALRKE